MSCTPTLEGFGVAELLVETPRENQDLLFQQFQCVPTGGALTTDSFELLFISQFAVRVGSLATQRVQVTNAGADPTQLVSITSCDPRFSAVPRSRATR